MVDILFKCPECSKHLAVDQVAQGKTVKCVDCGLPVQVPMSAIYFKCPSCLCDLFAPSNIAGETFDCPNCNGELSIPRPARPPTGKSPESIASETETTCEFCRKPMPRDAIQCSSCQNWRGDIHLLIDKYRKLALYQIMVSAIGGSLAAFVFVWGALQPSAQKPTSSTNFFGLIISSGSKFSFDKFVTTPSFAIGVLIVLAVVVAVVQMNGPAVRTRHRIEQATKGLWKRPAWTM